MATVKGTAGASDAQKHAQESDNTVGDIHAAIQKAKRTAQGAAHGALFRLETALADFKHCARTVEEHLGEDFCDILTKIESL